MGRNPDGRKPAQKGTLAVQIGQAPVRSISRRKPPSGHTKIQCSILCELAAGRAEVVFFGGNADAVGRRLSFIVHLSSGEPLPAKNRYSVFRVDLTC